MEESIDDPSTPLLRHAANRTTRTTGARVRSACREICTVQAWKRRVPITLWLPDYSWGMLLNDAIAGITVGLTAIPQGIAYAVLAGLPPQFGLYSSLFPGFVYMVFGSCKDVTVGPTAVLAILVSKHTALSIDFALLSTFLAGCIIFILGVLNLGFLLDFISKPVISGFTTAAALQIGASQLKALFRISGSSGNTFISAITNFFRNITTVKAWDTLLGISTIILLLLLKKSANIFSAHPSSVKAIWSLIVRARNALVVLLGAIIAYCLQRFGGIQPLALTGKIEGGLPHFGPPPFSTHVGNTTMHFGEMLSVLFRGGDGLVLPAVAVLESVAIAKAFAGGSAVDATQEMRALGLCNVLSSFCQSLPVTGSFTRTALNHASGVASPAGGLFKGVLVLLAVTLLTSSFYFIPRATLAAIIIVAMFSIVDFNIIPKLWRNSKWELLVLIVTLVTGLTAGLEYGILAGILTDVARILHYSARPTVYVDTLKIDNKECLVITLTGKLSYCSAEYLINKINSKNGDHDVIIFDGRFLINMDISVVENLVSLLHDYEKMNANILFWQFNLHTQTVLHDFYPNCKNKFINGASIEQYLEPSAEYIRI